MSYRRGSAESNPFRPHGPIDPERFVGRDHEVRRLKKALIDLKKGGNGGHFVIIGSPGIGKTSLLSYLHYMARGHIDLDDTGTRFDGLVIHTRIRENSTDIGIAEMIGNRLERELKNSDFRTMLVDFLGIISRIKAAGFSIAGSKEYKHSTQEALLDEFCHQLHTTAKRLCGEECALIDARFDGVVILLDECDRATPSTNIGGFFKDLLEISHEWESSHILVCLAGLPALHSALASSHRSSSRIFDELPLGRLSSSETGRVVDVALGFSGRELRPSKRIEEQARDMIIVLAEGQPYYVQRLGHAAFSVSQTDEISLLDVSVGAFGKGGAIQEIGNARFKYLFFEKLSPMQQEILSTIAGSWSKWVNKETILKRLGAPEALAPSLDQLVKDEVVIKRKGLSGDYRLTERSFGLWLTFYAGFYEDPESQNEVAIMELFADDLDTYHAISICGYTTWAALECYQRAEEAFGRGRVHEAADFLRRGIEACQMMSGFLTSHPRYQHFDLQELGQRSVDFLNHVRGPEGV